MPNIRPYTSPIEGISNPETASRAAADAGRRIGSSYSEAASFKTAGANAIAGMGAKFAQDIDLIGDVVTDYYATKETALGAKTAADIAFGINQQMNKAMRENPDDPTVGLRLREQAEPMYEKFKEGFTTEKGKKWAEGRVEAMRNHFDQKIIADEATRAGVAIQNNVDQHGNRLAANVYTNPEDFSFSLKALQDFNEQMKKSTPNLSAAQAAQMDLKVQAQAERLAKSALSSMANKNPTATIEFIKSGQFKKEFGDYISAGEAVQIVKSAEEIQRREIAQRRVDAAEQRRVLKERAESGAAKIVTSVIQQDGTIRVPPDYAKKVTEWQQVHGDAASADEARAMINFGISRAGEPALYSDPTVKEQIMIGLSLPPTDPRATTLTQLLTYSSQKKLTDPDLKLYKEMLESKTKDPTRLELHGRMMKQVEQYKSTITKSNPLAGIIKPEQDQQYGDYLARIEGMFNEAWQRGGYAEASKLLDPNSPNGIRSVLPDYSIDTKTGSKALQQRLNSGQINTPVVQPGFGYPRPVKTESFKKPPEAKPLEGPITGISVEPLPAIPQRLPGEKMEDYLRRRNGGK
jgi:hypothetical protein